MNEKSGAAFFNLADNVNLLSIIGAIVIFLTVFIVVSNAYRQMKKKREEVQLKDESWDGIKEYKNPLPLGWALMFVILMCFAIWYFLMGYPLNKYSAIGEYNEEVTAYNEKYNKAYETLDDKGKANMGEAIFTVSCAPCHGLEGHGMDGKAQDLTRWGSVEGIIYTLKHGSTGLKYDDDEKLAYYDGIMQKGEDLGVDEEDFKAVATYILSEISKAVPSKDEELLAKGKEVFDNTCAACHGEEGEGTLGVAPALNEYGKYNFVVNVLNGGKMAATKIGLSKINTPDDAIEGVDAIGDMPDFSHVLSKNQIEAVAHYISTLSKEENYGK